MKILFTQESDWLQKTPIQHHHFAELLSLEGHEVRVIDYELLWRTKGKKELYSKRKVFHDISKVYPRAGVTVIRPGILKIIVLSYASILFSHRREIKRQISEFKPDVIVGYGILSSYLAAREARKHDLPFVYHWVDVLHLLIPLSIMRPVGRMFERRTLKMSDAVVAVSENMKDTLVALGASRERVTVITPGVSLQQFNPGISGEAAKRQYGIQDDDIVLFFMGWLYRFSGLREIMLEMAKDGDSRVKLIIVGEGEVYRELLELRDQQKLDERVILTGRKPYADLPGLMAAATVCLMTAYPDEILMHDGIPGKIYEYMAMGKPVISNRLPAIMREFGEGRGVVYIDRPEDAVAVARELVRQNRVAELGAGALRFVADYDWHSLMEVFKKTLQGAIARKPGRSAG